MCVIYCKKGDLEQTPLFAVKSYIQARQTHQLFVNCVFDFGVVFHIEPGHVFLSVLAPILAQKMTQKVTKIL